MLNILRRKVFQQNHESHGNTLTPNVDKNINELSSYRLSLSEKLVICKGWKFSLPQKVSPVEIQQALRRRTERKSHY